MRHYKHDNRERAVFMLGQQVVEIGISVNNGAGIAGERVVDNYAVGGNRRLE